MALQITIISATGYEVSNAYVRVDEYSCTKDNTVNARLRAYISRQAVNEGKAHIEGSEEIIMLSCDYNDDADNTKKQIYEYAKTLDKFKNAIDC